MKFSAKQDVEAPISFVFEYLSDFDMWERSVMRRGAQVERSGKLVKLGTTWQATFGFRGKSRQMDVRLAKIAAPNRLGFTAQSSGFDLTFDLDVTEMSQRRARLQSTLEVTPRNLTARLFVQSMRLARARVDRRFAARLAQIVTDIETAYRSA